MKRLLAVAFAAALCAGCGSTEKDDRPPAGTNPSLSGRNLEIAVGTEETEVQAEGKAATLRVRNTGNCALSVCDAASCRQLAREQELELPVSGLCTFHLQALGSGDGRAKLSLEGGGDKATMRVR